MSERTFGILRSLLTSSLGGLAIAVSQRMLAQSEQGWVDLEQLELTLPHLAPEFDGFRLVQISDFHIGTWLDHHRLNQVVDQINQLKPDFVALTGDFVTFKPERFASDLTASLRRIISRHGSAAVLGNHDHWTDQRIVTRAIQDAGIPVLKNTHFTIKHGSASLHVAGVDDVLDGWDRLDQLLRRLPTEGAAILLAHEPDFADESAASGRFDLQLSGHSHGGQVVFPLIGAPILPRLSRKYPSGKYQVGSMIQYTNRGLGTAELQVRLNCRPEITIFSLHSPSAPGEHSKVC